MTVAPVQIGRKSLYIIDGHAQMYRAYHAIRGLTSPVTREPTNATFGFVGMLIKLFRDRRPDYVIVTIDVGGDRGTFRSEIYPEYKANRSETPDDFRPQVDRIVEICRMWNLPVLFRQGFEADDVIATLCTTLGGDPGLDIKIVSRDKDLEQLLTANVSLYDVHTDITSDVESLRRDKGLTPAQVVDALALMGDTVDNVPGVPGVGPKTAAKLISQYGSLEGVLAHTDELSGKLKESIEAAREKLPLSRQLVQLRHDVPLDFALSQAAIGPVPVDVLKPMFKQLGFTRHVTELEMLAGASTASTMAATVTITSAPAPTTDHAELRARNRRDADLSDGLFGAVMEEAPAGAAVGPSPYARANPADYQTITTPTQLDELVTTLTRHAAAGGIISVDTETDQLDPMRCCPVGISMSWQSHGGVYIPVNSPNPGAHLAAAHVLAALRPLLEDPAVRKLGHNMKYDMIVFRNAGVNLSGVAETGTDTIVASYLIDATRNSHKLDNLSLAHLAHEMIPISDLIGTGKKQKSMAEVPVEKVAVYAAEDADIALRLGEVFVPQMESMGLGGLFRELEMPLVEVLAELEYNGILVDPHELERQKKTIDVRIIELVDQILAKAGVHFNIDSTRQLADVLFNTLGCKSLKRGKTGPSTDSEVLQHIADEQPPPGSQVAELVLEYRMLTKLRGTYLESLKEAINPRTGRIHASFNQTIAATGRLSSSDPNLQNIPIRTDLGRQIRRAFRAPPGHVLLSADYSQIELRLLAHLSQDPALLEAFEKDLDIHTAVAAEVFGVPLAEVTSEQRGTAKMVNFGIVYGITPYGLARRLPASTAGSSVDAAKKIIDDYKRRYPKIDAFLARCVDMADANGYVETIAHRRRPIPEVRNSNPNIASLGRRMAINTVVQGSAADLIKIAMVRLHRRIRDQKLPMKMLLQIHDELVFETPDDHAEAMSRLVVAEMAGAMKLTVPLKVDTGWGATWFDSK
jgi:DNA polymerase-1